MILRYIIYSNLFVSLCVSALTLGSYVVLDKNPSWTHIMFSFFATLCMYNLHRYSGNTHKSGKNEIHPLELFSTKFSIWISSASAIILIFLAIDFKIIEFMILLPAGLISLFYVADLFLKRENTGLRAIPFVKIFLIAFVWSVITVVFPLANELVFLDTRIILLFAERFFFILAITIPFDIRDLGIDSKGLRTIPQVIGATKARYLAVLFILISSGITVFMLMQNMYASDMWIPAITFYMACIILLLNAKRNRSDYYFTLLIEGSMLIWGLILYALA